ncbi:unnamed protein product, partial [Heterosigma akashiwo]
SNYSLTIEFLDNLAGVCGPEYKGAIKARLQSHYLVKEFLAKWNLPIYFQLR